MMAESLSLQQLNDSDDDEQQHQSNHESDHDSSIAPSSDDVDNVLPSHTSTNDSDQIVLSVFWKKGKLGAAAYSVTSSEVHILNDIVDVNPEFKVLHTLFIQLQPWKVVTCRSLPQVFLKTVKSLIVTPPATVGQGQVLTSPSGDEHHSTTSNISSVGNPGPPSADITSDHLHLLPASNFHVDTARRMILALKLVGEPENASEFDRRNYILSQLNLTADAESLIAAFGGLLMFLGKSLAQINLQSVVNPVFAIRTISLNNLLWIDNETLKALQIFTSTLHPSPYKWKKEKNDEGMSILTLFNRCCSSLGSKHMRVLLSQPTQDLTVIKQRQDVIEFCLNSQNKQTVYKLTDFIKNINSVTAMMTRITNGRTSVPQWKSFYKTVYYAVLIGEVCRDNADKVQYFSKIAAHLCDSLYVMGHCIYRIIDFDDSFAENRFCVRSGISKNLDDLKEEYNRLPSMLSQLMQRDVENVPECANTYYMIYLPEVGYLLAITEWNREMSEDDIKNLPGLKFTFMANGVPYFKTACCLELDQLVGDVWVKIIEQESKIMLHLLEFIQRNIQPLLSILEPIVELDCLIALSKVAEELNYIRPEVVESETQVMEIIGGRHPLQELTSDSFIANDTFSSVDNGLIKVLTGPNCSGKSIYLKQVALIAYLAHVGSFVPAEKVKISILDQIHTRIQTTESVATQLSTFLIDLRQITLSIYNSSNRSLVVMDEFGKGTAEDDGLAILAGCLKHFISRGNNCPHLLVSTHFHLLPELLPQTPLLRFEHPDYLIENDELIYLYKLKPGFVKSSLATQFASANGLSETATLRANQVYELIKKTKNFGSDDDKEKRNKMISSAESVLRRLQSVLDLQNEDCLKKYSKEIYQLLKN